MTKSQQIDQRIGVFVDTQNMYYSARQLHRSKANFKTILKEAIADRKIIRAIAYVIKADVKDESMFYNVWSEMGFEVKSKDLQVFYGGAKKGDWDIGIAMDMIELAPKLDVLVLISGDGDFVPLLQHLKRAMGCKAEVIAFGRTASSKLKEEADSFTDMDKSRKYLIKNVPASRKEKPSAKN